MMSSFLVSLIFMMSSLSSVDSAAEVPAKPTPDQPSVTCKSPDQFNYGQWIPGAENCGLLNKYKGATSVAQFSEWCWKPQGCEAVKFTAKGFCDLVAGKKILLIGDSLMYNMYEAFYHELESEGIQGPLQGDQWFYAQWPISKGKICNGRSQLVFLRNDHWLISGEASDKHRIKRPVNMNWKGALPVVDIVIMNKGHHVRSTEVTVQQFKDQTTEAIQYIKNYMLNERPKDTTKKQLSMYFLETSPGHALCKDSDTAITTPLLNREQYYKMLAQYQHEKLSLMDSGYKYGWWDYERHDEYIENLFTTQLNGTVIPVTHMTFLRPDGHVKTGDCLHYPCTTTPSVVDNWVFVFYNLLLNDKLFQQ